MKEGEKRLIRKELECRRKTDKGKWIRHLKLVRKEAAHGGRREEGGSVARVGAGYSG